MRVISFIQKKKMPERRRAIRDYYKKKSRKKFSFTLFLLLFFLLAISFIYLIFSTPLFKIRIISFQIKDNPLVKVDENELRSEINKILSKNFYFLSLDNILFFSKKEMENLFRENQKIENFEIKKIFPKEIKIKISAWQPQAILSQEANYFLLNKNGQPIKKIEKNEIGEVNLPVIYNQTKKENFPFLSLFDFIKRLTGSDFAITEIEIIEEKGILNYRATTLARWKIYFDPQGNIDEQINKLFSVLREKIVDQTKLEYIDLRFGERIFYK